MKPDPASSVNPAAATRPASGRVAAGFSLVELMVAMIAGLLVVGSVLAFTVSSVRSNAEYITSTRLTQELRGTIDFATRELRRAGYDQNYMAQIARSAGSPDQSAFSPILLAPTEDCVIYAYDRQPGVPGVVDPANGELRGLRYVQVGGVGVVEAATSDAVSSVLACDDPVADYSTYPATCTGAWCAITDPRTLNISQFVIDDVSPQVIEGLGVATVPMRIREFEFRLAGNLSADPEVSRAVRSRVRVRADCLRTGMTTSDFAACVAVPST